MADSHSSIGPALGGLVLILIVIMGVVFTGFNQMDKHLDRMLQVSDLNESITLLDRQLTDGYRFLSLSSDELLGSRRGVDVDEFVREFNRRLVRIDSLNSRVRTLSDRAGMVGGVEVSRHVDDLHDSLVRVMGSLHDHPADATVELMTVSDPLSAELLSADLPALANEISEQKHLATASYDRVSMLSFVIISFVFLGAYVIALILISHIAGVQKERRLMEEDLREAMEEAKAASYEKSRFLSNMSHELRTPMNGVIGMANVLSSRDMPADQRRMVTVLKESADSALALINDILDFEAIEAGKVSLEARTFELSDVTRKIQAMASTQLMGKHIDFSISMETGLPRRVRGDDGRLIQILTNLVSNAIKFTKEGTVEVLVKKEGPSNISFTVRDTGIGIAPDHIDRLFESFRQADNSIRRQYGGTGLGLSITRSLVHMMGGSIRVSSAVGEGSTFVITLPLSAVAQPAKRESASSQETPVLSTPKRAITVLCVDDNLINLEVARAVLEEAGHTAILASSGQDGLRKHSEINVDVVLMDCHMDGMDGYETAKRMLALQPDLPIVALTADATTSAVETSQAAGMCGVMTKPFKPAVLIETVERLGMQGCTAVQQPPTNPARRQGEVTASGVSSSSA